MKIKVIDCYNTLQKEFQLLRALDDKNQQQFSAGDRITRLTKTQMYLLTEAVFFAAFRAYEQFLRNSFLIYCCGIQPGKRKLVRSFLQPKTLPHAEMLVKSSMPFLDWSSPDTVIERAEAYLKDGYPIKAPLAANLETLRVLKKIRNHIAHMSNESTQEYKKVVKAHFGTVPFRLPVPGQYLLFACRNKPDTYYLQSFLATMELVARQMA